MPLNIKIPNPAAYAGAVLPAVAPVLTLAERIALIPGLLGGWDASTLAQGAAVAAWAARYGTGTASQATAARQPVAGLADDLPVVRNPSQSRNLVVDKAFTSGAVLTVGARFKIENTAQDFQAIFGIGTWRLLYRTAGNFQFDVATDVMANGVATPGWHTVLVMQSADTTRMLVDGVLFAGANAPAAMTQLMLGASANTGTANGWLGATRRVIIAEADLHGTDHQQTALDFLNAA